MSSYNNQNISFNTELLDDHLRDLTDCESSDNLNEDLKPLPDLDTIWLKVEKVLWIYFLYSVKLQYVCDIRSLITMKSQLYLFT